MKRIKIKKKLADEIEKLLTSDNFGWYYNHTTAYEEKKLSDTFQFTHKFYDEIYNAASYYYQNALELFQSINIKYKKFLRIKANFTVPSLNLGTKHQLIHRDIENEHITNKKYPTYKQRLSTFLYYVNDSDGDTIFYDDNKKEIKKFKPKKGTGLIFKSNILHAGSNPVKYDKRIVINYNFYE